MARSREYREYMQSLDWFAKRKEFLTSGVQPFCYRCRKPWTPRFEVHHATYERLGQEALTDLRLMCKPCHRALHKAHRALARPTPLHLFTEKFCLTPPRKRKKKK